MTPGSNLHEGIIMRAVYDPLYLFENVWLIVNYLCEKGRVQRTSKEWFLKDVESLKVV